MADKDLKQAGTLGGGKWERLHDISRRVYDEEGVSPTIPTTGGAPRSENPATPQR